MGFHIADIVLAGLLVLAILYGWRWGTINVVAKVGALVLAYQVARAYSAPIAAKLVHIIPALGEQLDGASEEGGRQLLAVLSVFMDTTGMTGRLLSMVVFIIIFVVINWAVRRIAYMLTGIFGRGLLGKINRALGAFIALALMVAIIIIFDQVLLPASIGLGFGMQIETFIDSSKLIMPLIRNLPLVI
ncbi:MAG: hypothetical protein GX572_02760 [Clostridia bacterium]|nr:hypothetical protein [Clostridia bacterium]